VVNCTNNKVNRHCRRLEKYDKLTCSIIECIILSYFYLFTSVVAFPTQVSNIETIGATTSEYIRMGFTI